MRQFREHYYNMAYDSNSKTAMINSVNYYEIRPEENTFKVIYVDASHRCNMACLNCFIPNREIPDLDLQKYCDFIDRLQGRVEIRLFGGEPTMNKQLFEIISYTRKAGHSVTLITNGLKLSERSYVSGLREAGLREVNISMNGGTDRDLYKKLDNLDCLDRKLAAVDNSAAARMRLRFGAILIKGQNDHVPEMLYQLALKYDLPVTLNFRNVAQVGRYTLKKDQNFKFEEMVKLICDRLGYNYDEVIKSNVVNSQEQERIVLFTDKAKTKQEGRKHSIWIKITDWSPPGESFPDPNSKRRGRLTGDFMLAPCFEHIKRNENGY